ncbi:DUF1345 domain-containing protein [Microbacterium hatanonis]|uniref:DUF1345 domain-containing protein n=1 Tax=Microbacterium hatanonis TaxID=404366 RepID=A0A5C8I3X9_9MICO|nr:DUF1345 domain-containing protein [Microbacterium hatanonis]TXK12665.1 DUF1345 domain-containing protein [Microbacterium hatanonis]
MSDQTRDFDDPWHRAWVRVGVLFLILIAVTVAVGAAGSWAYAPAVGWIAASATFISWEWGTVLRLGPADTASHATREDPTRATAQGLLLLASLASFGAIALVLYESGSVTGPEKFALVAIALFTVAASWCLVHVLFTLRYAAIYYRDGGTGVDFNQTEPPQYRDFAYLAFTLGMTYQVSDTNLTSSTIRREALRHALISFVLGVVVLAATINLVATLIA